MTAAEQDLLRLAHQLVETTKLDATTRIEAEVAAAAKRIAAERAARLVPGEGDMRY